MKQRIPNKLETNALRTARNAAFVCMCAISCVGCNPNLDVDGALIGGASLDPEELAKIAKFHLAG